MFYSSSGEEGLQAINACFSSFVYLAKNSIFFKK